MDSGRSCGRYFPTNPSPALVTGGSGNLSGGLPPDAWRNPRSRGSRCRKCSPRSGCSTCWNDNGRAHRYAGAGLSPRLRMSVTDRDSMGRHRLTRRLRHRWPSRPPLHPRWNSAGPPRDLALPGFNVPVATAPKCTAPHREPVSRSCSNAAACRSCDATSALSVISGSGS